MSKLLKDISEDDVGKKLVVFCCIEKVFQTKGPTLFKINDGSAGFIAKGFAGPGKRSFPDLDERMCVKMTLLIKQYEGELEADLVDYVLLNSEDAAALRSLVHERTKVSVPKDFSFLINSPVYEKMRSLFHQAATLIHQAVAAEQPTYIRHHGDTDGYAAGLILEHAIEQLPIDPRRLKRFSMRPPFYELTDVLKDLGFALADNKRYDVKMPLVIVTDNGSSEQDVFALKLLKEYGCSLIVLDHHPIDDRIDSIVDCHINPLQHDSSGAISAAMLCAELAHILAPAIEKKKLLSYAAIGGTLDKQEGTEIQQYTQNFDISLLEKIGACIDFIGYVSKFSDTSLIMNDLFYGERQQALVDLFYTELELLTKPVMERANQHVELLEDKGNKIYVLDLKKIAVKGEYPRSGKIVGAYHDLNEGDHVTLGVSDSFIVVRITGDYNFLDLLALLKTTFPHFGIAGGGHPHAGTVHCLPAFLDDVKKEVVQFFLS